MTIPYSKTQQPFHKWLLESKYVLNVEQLDQPEKSQWWVITHKETLPQLTKHLNITVKDIIQKIHPSLQEYEVQPEDKRTREQLPSAQMTTLLDRLVKQIPIQEITQPTNTGRTCRPYTKIARHHNQQLLQHHNHEKPIQGLTQVTESTVSSTFTNPPPPLHSSLKKWWNNNKNKWTP